MKSPRYQKRFYRDWVTAEGLHRCRIVCAESDLNVYSDRPVDEALLKECLGRYRRQIADYGSMDPRFFSALKPLGIAVSAPPIVVAMGRAAHAAGVGPMAAVAGAIAQFVGRVLLRRGCRDVIIENGGDIFCAIRTERIVRLFCGKASAWKGLGIRVKAHLTPLGICTSSGTIGHSLSFGDADAAVILARDALLADAVATAACNRIREVKDLQKTTRF